MSEIDKNTQVEVTEASIEEEVVAATIPSAGNENGEVNFAEDFEKMMVTIRPGVWHCMPFTVNTDVINVLNVLPERTYANDCTMKLLKEEERIRIVL